MIDLGFGEILPVVKMHTRPSATSSAAVLRPIASRPAPAATRSELQLAPSSSHKRIYSCMPPPARWPLCAPCPRVDMISNTSFSKATACYMITSIETITLRTILHCLLISVLSSNSELCRACMCVAQPQPQPKAAAKSHSRSYIELKLIWLD